MEQSSFYNKVVVANWIRAAALVVLLKMLQRCVCVGPRVRVRFYIYKNMTLKKTPKNKKNEILKNKSKTLKNNNVLH